MSKRYELDDDSLEAIVWRSDRWAEKPKRHSSVGGGGFKNADIAPSCASRAARDRMILVEIVLRRGAPNA